VNSTEAPADLTQGQKLLARRAATISIACERLKGQAAVAMEIANQGASMAAVKKREPKALVHHASKSNARLKAIGGSRSDHWNNILANQTVQALWLHSDPETRDKQYSATVAALVGIEPKDEL
jgi:hypothetical protein